MEILGGCLALLLLITIAVLVIMVLRKLLRPSPETIAEERARAEEQAKVILQMVEDDWPFPRWQVIRAYEICNWVKDHPDRRLPKHLRCSLSEYEDMLNKQQEQRLDNGDITGWKVADKDFDTW